MSAIFRSALLAGAAVPLFLLGGHRPSHLPGPRGASLADLPSAKDCQSRFKKHAVITGNSGEESFPGGARITIYPDDQSASGNASDLHGKRKWLGFLYNFTDKPYDDLHVAPNSLGVTCLYFNGDAGGDKGLITFITPTGYQPKNPVEWMWLCTTSGGGVPHAHWVQPNTCSKLTGYIGGLRALSIVDPAAIAAKLEELNRDSNVPWVSCASDGCCRIKG
jgi:hypothetical protein